MFDPLIAFQHHGIKQTGHDRYLSKCPAHEDRSPSLSITTTAEKILLHCHAGCTPQSIVESVGYSLGDLFPEDEKIKQDFRQAKKVQIHEAQFITDFQIVKLAECDLARNKKLSESDTKLASEAYTRLTKIDNPEKLHKDLTQERAFNVAYQKWNSLSMEEKYGSLK